MAVAVAVPLALAWMVIELVGGALYCAGIDGPCGAGALDFLGGMAAIIAGAAVLAWTINRVLRGINQSD